MATAKKKPQEQPATVTLTLSYGKCSKIRNNTEKLKTLRDDDAIALFAITNTLEAAFRDVQSAVNNVIRQISTINKDIAAKKAAIKKLNLPEEEQKSKTDALLDEIKPIEQELNEELENLRQKEREVIFTPFPISKLKAYKLCTLENLETFKDILSHE